MLEAPSPHGSTFLIDVLPQALPIPTVVHSSSSKSPPSNTIVAQVALVGYVKQPSGKISGSSSVLRDAA